MFEPDVKPLVTSTGPFNYGRQIRLTIRRLDLIDPVTGGNKWFKLRLNLSAFKTGSFRRIVTFGGAFSNHIAAVARTCFVEGIPATGIIRGEPESASNITLTRAKQDGMELIFVSRSDYRKKEDLNFLRSLLQEADSCHIIPEGGSNIHGVTGCTGILSNEDDIYTHIVVACGTGATAAGLILNLKKSQHLIGINVLRNNNQVENVITNFLIQLDHDLKSSCWNIEKDFHFGGYGKTTAELNEFVHEFTNRTGVPIEPVYTGKIFYAIEKMIENGRIPFGSNVLAIHTGGLQYLQKY